MKIRIRVTFTAALLFAALSLPTGPAAASSVCTWFFRSEKDLAGMDPERFAERKKAFRATSGTPPLEALEPYEVLAWMETIAERDGFDVLRLSRVIAEGSPAERKRLFKIADRMRSRGQWTREDLRAFFAKLYLAANPPLPHWPLPKFLKNRIPLVLETAILRRLEMDLASKPIEEAFRDAGFLRDPVVFGWFARWKAEHPLIYESARFAAWNIFWVKAFGAPGILPRPIFSQLPKLTDELAKKYKILHPRQLKDLPAPVYAEVIEKFGVVGDVDAGLAAFDLAYTGLILGVFAYFILDEETQDRFVTLWEASRTALISNDRLREYQERTFDCAAKREELWQSFRQGFHELYGMDPEAAKHPHQRAVIEENRKRIYDASCESLKVRFD
jgi:hypothetical protein